MKKLIVLIGLPRSGKSSYAQKQGFPIVNKDSIRLALHGQRFLTESEEWVHVIAKTMVKSLFYAGHDTIVLDECNVTQKGREQWIDAKWDVEFVEISTSEEECLRRAKEDNDETIISVIERMSNEYEPLEKEE